MIEASKGLVLVVEDDSGTAMLERRNLEKAGYTVITALTTDEARSAIQQGGVDLMVLDYTLPCGVTGLEFLAQIKAEGHDLPVIMATGMSDDSIVIAALRVGVRDFVIKSVGFASELPQAVECIFVLIDTRKRLVESEARLRESQQQRIEELSASNVEMQSVNHKLEEAQNQLLQLNEHLESRVRIRSHELELAKQLAEAANIAKSQFLANMSHEIRTPMNSIMGMAYLALQAEIDPKQRIYIHNIYFSAQNLLGIINDILDISKIESGNLTLESIDFNLDQMLVQLSSLLAESASKKGLKLTFKTDELLSRALRGDPLRLRQVLTNLISNAIKFSVHGEVIVRIKSLPTAEGEMRVRFEIQDSGIGLSPEQIKDLFQAFHQADTTITRKYGGTGLGLAISKRLVEMMGGEIGVESQPGKGSTFWFNILLGKGEMLAETVAEASDPELSHLAWQVLKGAKILVVEDIPVNQMLVQELLEMQGVIVTIANNGLEALAIMQKQAFDCVLMDMQMPVMDGLEATRQIRAHPALKDSYIVAVTANAHKEDWLRCSDAGMNDFISKPIDVKTMYSILAKWVSASVQNR